MSSGMIVGRVEHAHFEVGNWSFTNLPSGNLLQFAIEHDHRKFVDLPIDSMVIFQFANFEHLPEGNYPLNMAIFHVFFYVYQRDPTKSTFRSANSEPLRLGFSRHG